MRRLLLGILFLIGSIHGSQAQILQKVKAAVKKVAKETTVEVVEEVECALFDKDCIRKAQEAGQKVVITNPEKPAEIPTVSESTKVSKTASSPSGTEVTNQFEEKTKKILCGEYDRMQNLLRYNENLSLVLTTGHQGSRQVILINGVPGSPYDLIDVEEAKVSESGENYAYLAQREGTCYVILNGKEVDQSPCSEVTFENLTFNRDGSLFYYFKKLPERNIQVVINGEEGPVLSSLHGFRIIETPGGEHLFYATGKDYSQNLYKNNRKLSEDNLQHIEVSNDGQTYAYVLHNGKFGNERNYKLVINGKESPWHQEMTMGMNKENGAIFYKTETDNKIIWSDKTFSLGENEIVPPENFFQVSADGERVAYVVQKNGMARVYDNGKPGPPFVRIQRLVITENGENLIYTAGYGVNHFAVINGQELGPFTDIREVRIGEKGGSYFIRALKNGSAVTFYNGKPLEQDINNPTIMSPNLKIVQIKNDPIEINGQPYHPKRTHFVSGNPHDRSNGAVFNAEEDRFAYVLYAGTGGSARSWLVLDGKFHPSVSYDSQFGFPVFSEDGKNFAHLEKIQERPEPQWRLYVNMKPGPIIGKPIEKMENVIQFKDNRTLRVLGMEGTQVYKYEIKI